MTTRELLAYTETLAQKAWATKPPMKQRPLRELTPKEKSVLPTLNQHRIDLGLIDHRAVMAEHGLSRAELSNMINLFERRGLLVPATGRYPPVKMALRTPGEAEQLVKANEGLMVSVINNWVKSYPNDIDSIQSGAKAGLARAAQLFNPERGFAFSTYAVAVMNGTIKKAFRDKEAERKRKTLSLQEPINGGSEGLTLGDVIGYEPDLEKNLRLKDLVGRMHDLHRRGILPEGHLLVFLLRKMHDLTLDDVARVISEPPTTGERIRQMEKKAREIIADNLREYLR